MPDSLIVPVGRFIEGMDTIHAEDDDVFSPVATANGFSPPRRCIDASNVDLDNTGRPQIRPGTVERVAATAGLDAFSALGLLLFQDQGVIKRVTVADPFTTASLVTGLNAAARVVFHEHAGSIWWTNGIENGQITAAGVATNWGLSVAPTPTLGTTTGTLPAGSYGVSATWVDTNGVEHAAGEIGVVTLAGLGSITVNLTPVPTGAVSALFYATEANGTALYFVGTAAVGSLPVTISSVDSSFEHHRRRNFSPPVPGDGMFSYHGMMVTFGGAYLQPSYGPAVHLYELDLTEESRPSDIKAGAGLSGGFWTVCERGAFWTTGDMPGDWETNQRDNRKYAAGTLVLPGSLIPALELADNVALFVSEDGLMAGLPNGSMVPLTDDKHRLDVTDQRASIVYHQHTNFDQILFNLI